MPPAPDSGPRSLRHGIWRILPSPHLTEILAQSGLDFQIFDCEHGGYDYQSLLTDLLACELNRCTPWVRVSGTNAVEVQRCLDLGAQGLVFPQLGDLKDFTRAAAMMDHAPKGTRGFNPFVRGYGYGSRPKATRPAFVPIVETLTAVEQLDSILQLKRIDMIYIGTYDLSAQLGVPGQMTAPALLRVVDRILAACRAAGKPAAIMSLQPTPARRLLARGVRAVVHGVESDRIKKALTAEFGQFSQP